MIIMVGGIPCSGKTTLVRNILNELGPSENIEPMKLFSCQAHGDILVVGRYAEGEQFGGTDRLSYGTISKFRDFIIQEVPKWKHIIIEGDRFFRSKDVEWLLNAYSSYAKIYVLMVNRAEEIKRHILRKDTQTEKWLSGRRTQISNLLTNFELMNELEIRDNNNNKDADKIKEEICHLICTKQTQ